MPKFEQPDQGKLDFQGTSPKPKRWGFWGEYTSQDRANLVSRISRLLNIEYIS